MVGQRPLKPFILVRIQARQQKNEGFFVLRPGGRSAKKVFLY